MIKNCPKELAYDLLGRSPCNVQVSAVIEDSRGIFVWGWNSVGDGDGLHAEIHAISRANRKRLKGSTIYVVGRRKKSGSIIFSRPCNNCWSFIKWVGIKDVYYSTFHGKWKYERIV